jgi:hypothetical protein
MSKSEPVDKELYDKIKKEVWEIYKKPSAYRSAMLVRLYRESGGKYSGKPDINSGLPLWFASKWRNIRGKEGYQFKSDIYRPTVRVNDKTPITYQELTKEEIERARREKYETGRVKQFKKDK